MTEAQAAALRRLATAREQSQAALLREALDDLIAGEQVAQRCERAREPVGMFPSGHTDTADRHDDVLAEAYDE